MVSEDLEGIVGNPELPGHLLEVLIAAKSIYGFTGGDNGQLGKAIYEVTMLMEALNGEDSDAVSA